jgi:flagellar motor switch protein FliN/FliY
MANPTAGANHRSFSSAFFNAFAGVMTAASKTPWSIVAVPEAEAEADKAEVVRIRLTLGGGLAGEFLLEFRREEAAMLASKLLRKAGSEFGDEQAAALLKAVTGAASEFRTASAAEYGAFNLEASAAAELPSGWTKIAQAAATSSDKKPIRALISMHMNPALTEALGSRSAPGSAAAGAAEADETPEEPDTPDPANLDLVMDVELSVTLRFGQRRLSLREVLDLTTGSVVELDRQVDEPVELLLDGIVIARGEAVVIDGNYGLRVTEVSRPVTATMLR